MRAISAPLCLPSVLSVGPQLGLSPFFRWVPKTTAADERSRRRPHNHLSTSSGQPYCWRWQLARQFCSSHDRAAVGKIGRLPNKRCWGPCTQHLSDAPFQWQHGLTSHANTERPWLQSFTLKRRSIGGMCERGIHASVINLHLDEPATDTWRHQERLAFHCRTTSASTAPRTPRRTCCPYAYVLITVLCVSRSCELFPDGFDLHLLHGDINMLLDEAVMVTTGVPPS